MGRSALLFAFSAAAWGSCTVKSFSFLPGALHQASSCKPAAPIRRTTLARSNVALRATTTPAAAESTEYLENKEALKQVCHSLCNLACTWLDCFTWKCAHCSHHVATYLVDRVERVRSKQRTLHTSDTRSTRHHIGSMYACLWLFHLCQANFTDCYCDGIDAGKYASGVKAKTQTCRENSS